LLFPKKQHIISCEHITICRLSVPYILVNVRCIEKSFEYTFFIFVYPFLQILTFCTLRLYLHLLYSAPGTVQIMRMR